MTPTNKEELIEDVRLRAALAAATMRLNFKALKQVSKTNSRITILGFRKADLGLFGYLLGKILCETALKGKGVQKS